MVKRMILSVHYNKLIKLPSAFSYEKLYRKEKIYDIIIVLNYNMRPNKNKEAQYLFISQKKLQKN